MSDQPRDRAGRFTAERTHAELVAGLLDQKPLSPEIKRVVNGTPAPAPPRVAPRPRPGMYPPHAHPLPSQPWPGIT